MSQLEQRALDDLIPYAKNARKHSAAQIDQIVASIRAFGFTNPILVDSDKGALAGHGRIAAARKLGLTHVPVIELSHLTPAQRRAYIIADNQHALNASWDDALLASELRDILGDEGDALALGFEQDEIDKLLGNASDAATAAALGAYQYAIIVDCTSERDQAAMLAQLESEGRTCRLLTT